LKDTTRAPEPGDGIYFPPFQEGKPGVQPERLGPYTSTLNPGYDPSLPLYRTWPLFQAIQAAFGDTAQQPETAPPPKRITTASPNFAAATLLSADTTHALRNLLTELGMALDRSSRLVILDGAHPPVDSASLALARRTATLLVWGPVPGTEKQIDLYLPSPLEVSARNATSFVVKATDPVLEGLDNADFYYSETAPQPVSRFGLVAPSATTLLEDCNTDWKTWNNRPEYMKTIAVLRSQREAKPPGAALIKFPGQVYCLALDPLALCKASEPTVRRLFENLGLRFTGNAAKNPPAFDTVGALRNALVAGKLVHSFDGVFTCQRGDTLSFWLYSPRSLVNLLVEPDLPTLILHVHTEGTVNVYVGDKKLDSTVLPLDKGWNKVRVIPAARGRSLKATLDCNRPAFLHELSSNVFHP
jgi:beta-galactosidase